MTKDHRRAAVRQRAWRRASLGASARALLLASAAVLGTAGAASAMGLREAVSIALDSNPTIGQAIMNREAIEFELRQARGLYLPRLDVESSYGVQRYSNANRRLVGTQDKLLQPADVGATVTQKLFDGFGREAEVERQASRVDGASFRVLERAEYIALAIAREYIEVLLQQRILGLANENVSFHRRVLGDIDAGVRSGTLTDADKYQASERVTAAIAKQKQAEEDLASAKIRFYTLVGQQIGVAAAVPSIANTLPRSLADAIGKARLNNPQIAGAGADVDAGEAQVKAARSRYYPELFLEGRARTGNDIETIQGNTNDLQGRAVLRWNLYDGGIKSANEQEQIRRASELRLKLHQTHREVEEVIRISWERRGKQNELSGILARQASEATRVVNAYQDQFKVGRRSLLDVLDAQNARFNASVLTETARYASVLSEYRLSAATGQLVATLGLTPPSQADAYARAKAGVPPTPEAETYPRYSPTR
ncbi:TolC family outer membrane protein [Alsobacter sp. R-9]